MPQAPPGTKYALDGCPLIEKPAVACGSSAEVPCHSSLPGLQGTGWKDLVNLGGGTKVQAVWMPLGPWRGPWVTKGSPRQACLSPTTSRT